ncbi:MAG: trigger factor [Mycoplasmoidaceae bacterium]|nr:trigger factor [Mycoplasmoidaceae bacterium]
MQGFRKGHVPQAEIDKRISDAEVAMRTLEKQQNQIIQDIIASKEFKDSNCIDSVSKLEVVKLEPTPVIKVNFELVPKVEDFAAKDVKEISLPPYKAPEVSETMVKQQIKMMIKPDAMLSAKKDGIVAKGNIAVIDFKGFIDGKAFKGGEGKNFELEIGSKSFIDNFEDQLIGCKKGDKKDVNVTFPKDYGMKDYAGKPAKFEVVINDVKEIEYPEITKDYCKKFGMDCANMKELEAHIKSLFVQETEMRYQDMAMRVINDAIGKKAKLNYYPTSLINMHKNQILRQYEQEGNRSGFKTLEQYKKALGVDQKMFEETLTKSAKTTLTVAMVYEKLIEDYKLKVEEADTKDYLSKLTRYVGDEKKAKEMFEKNKDYAESNILRDKLFKKLIAECKKEAPKKDKK